MADDKKRGKPIRIPVKGPASVEQIEQALRAKLGELKTNLFAEGEELIIEINDVFGRKSQPPSPPPKRSK